MNFDAGSIERKGFLTLSFRKVYYTKKIKELESSPRERDFRGGNPSSASGNQELRGVPKTQGALQAGAFLETFQAQHRLTIPRADRLGPD